MGSRETFLTSKRGFPPAGVPDLDTVLELEATSFISTSAIVRVCCVGR